MLDDPDIIKLMSTLKQTLSDWKYIIKYMEKHPTSVQQLVLKYSVYIGFSNACCLEAGGVWCSDIFALHPFLWQVGWSPDIQANLVTAENRNGFITMNSLELAGAVLNWLALECQPNIALKQQHVGTYCDNTLAVAWAHKLRTSKSTVAACLLYLLSLHIHSRKASGLTPLNIAGDSNSMADIVLHAFKSGQYFHASTNLTYFFNSNFPLSQNASWYSFQIPKRLASWVIACLHGEPLPMGSLCLRLPKLGKNIGPTEQTMQDDVE